MDTIVRAAIYDLSACAKSQVNHSPNHSSDIGIIFAALSLSLSVHGGVVCMCACTHVLWQR